MSRRKKYIVGKRTFSSRERKLEYYLKILLLGVELAEFDRVKNPELVKEDLKTLDKEVKRALKLLNKIIQEKENYINVKVIKTPVTERYCKINDILLMDKNTNQVRSNIGWLTLNDRWEIEEIN